MRPTNKIKTILIGLGRIASKLEDDPHRYKPCTHSGVIHSNWGKRHFSLEAIADVDSKQIQNFKERWQKRNSNKIQSILTKDNFDKANLKLVKDLDLQFAIIATPSISHYDISISMLELGIQNLLIEKPVCLSSKEAKILSNLAKKKRANIWINHERRYHPRYQYVRDLIKKGELGNVQSVRANVYTSARNPGLAFSKFGGGPLLHDGTHAIDILNWLFGKLNLRYANVNRPSPKSIENRATALFETKNGIQIFLDVSGGLDYFQFEIDILLEKARIVLSNDGFRFFKSQPSKLYQGFKSLEEVPFLKIPSLNKSNAFMGIYSEIESVINGKSNNREGTLQDNIDILESIESIYKFRRKS